MSPNVDNNNIEITWEDASEDEKAVRRQLYPGERSVMVEMTMAKPVNCYLPIKFKSMYEKIRNFECREDDVWMITYPKAGSTVMQELVWQIVNGFDVEGGKENIFTRAPFFEMSMLCETNKGCTPSMESKNPGDQMALLMNDAVDFVGRMKGPRVIKTHLPLALLPQQMLEKSRVIWINRNCKDSCNSWFNHERMLPPHGFVGEFSQLVDMYVKGKVLYGDYWALLREGYSVKEMANVHHFWYEEFRADIRKVIRDIAAFLKVDFPETKVEALADHLHIDNFRNNDACNMKPPKGKVPDEVRDKINFIRKGHVGGWKNENFSADDIAKFDKWIAENNAELKAPYHN